jgi:flagellum-specific ATP synthase
MSDVTIKDHQELAGKFKEALATYRQSEDLINIGAYKAGSNSGIDYAISKYDSMMTYIKQAIDDPVPMQEAMLGLQKIFES